LSWNLANYRRNPVVLAFHNYKSLPVAKTTSINQVGDSLVATASFVPADVSEFADQCYKLARDGWMAGCSVGFKPSAGGVKANSDGGYDFTDAELLEWSLVPVSAHQDALRRSMAKSGGREVTTEAQAREIIIRALDGGSMAAKSPGADEATARRIIERAIDTDEVATFIRALGQLDDGELLTLAASL
jgi:Caudovirus prohead serine protease